MYRNLTLKDRFILRVYKCEISRGCRRAPELDGPTRLTILLDIVSAYLKVVLIQSPSTIHYKSGNVSPLIA